MSNKEEANSATLMATTSDFKVQEEILEEGTRKKVRPRKAKEPIVQENAQLQLLQETVEQLQRQVGYLSMRQGSGPPSEEPLLENKLIKLSKTRLRFDIKDVYGSIETWDHFFQLYRVESDYEKFFAVEQLLPFHVQKAMSTNRDLETSYKWLVSYLKGKYDPKYACYDMSYRTLTRTTNIGELEDLAIEAANCPNEHIVKHFMLDACTYQQRQRMRPFLFLPMREFKFKLKMVAQDDGGRFNGNFSENRPSRFNGNFSGNRPSRFNGNQPRNGQKVNAISVNDGPSCDLDVLEEEGNQSTSSSVREFQRSHQSGNDEA